VDPVTLGMAKSDAKKKFANKGSVASRWGRRTSRPKLAPMATPPTVTLGTGSGGAATTAIVGSSPISWTDPRLRIIGSDYIQYPNDAAYAQFKPLGTGTTKPRGSAVRFGFEGQAFEFGIQLSAGARYRILVNGVPATALWQTVGGTTNFNYLVKVDLGTRDVYDITIQLFNVLFRGVRTLATDPIFAAHSDNPLRMHILGDSFVFGQSYAAGANVDTPGMVYRLGELLGIEDVWGRGIGGTGYIASGQTFQSRLAQDVIPYAPDILFIPGSINDTNTLPVVGAIASAVNVIHAQVKAALPNCLIIASSILHAGQTNDNIVAVNADLKATWMALGVPYVDVTGINTGSGKEGAPTGTGSADFNRSDDGSHLTYPLGYDHTATRLALGIAPILRDAFQLTT
jgi:hypothetical protein